MDKGIKKAVILSANGQKRDDAPKQESKKTKGKLFDNIYERLKKVKHLDIILAGIFALAVILIFFVGQDGFFGMGVSKDDQSEYIGAYEYCVQTEAKLSRILSTVKGAGKVEVMINFESTPEQILAYIVSVNSNKSASGDNHYNESESKTETPQIINVNGKQVPLVLKEFAPKVIGVLIVAEGADNVKTRMDLLNATAVLLDISKENIIILTMNKAR